MALGLPYFDANIDTPVEVEGSPSISTDEITRAKLIQRSLAVRKEVYNPLVQGARDPVFPNAYLINEVGGQHQGPVLWFNRNYAEKPASRTEPRLVSFTYPGKSEVQLSQLTSLPIGWNPYGVAAPLTQPVMASANFTYAVQTSLGQDPASLFVAPALSALTYAGNKVDYTGSVYVSVGSVSVPQGFGLPPLTEQRFRFAGVVGGFFGGTWIYSVDIRRWRGPIWEMEVVQIPNLFFP